MVTSENDKIEDVCQDNRQDFDICQNIDHQKTKKLKKKHKTNNKTHKQTSDQTNKQTNKQRNKKTTKTNKRCRLFFLVRCNGWSHCVRPNDTNKNPTSKQSREPTQTHELYM